MARNRVDPIADNIPKSISALYSTMEDASRLRGLVNYGANRFRALARQLDTRDKSES